ncbi:P-selectin glycoprotein ligand 1 [Nycticebus coucang]|uniref:P-selectin glycoprotein ligand 1 n=1 Tax=Nycticebus coucang TaxID=9470 RepID=UPI00234D2FE5|nr:P-selectin glycoprotein ligand 1 [Nycticebus coucang]
MPLQLLLLLTLVGPGSSLWLWDTRTDGARKPPGPLLARGRRQASLEEDYEYYSVGTDPPEELNGVVTPNLKLLTMMGTSGQRSSVGPQKSEPTTVEATTRHSAGLDTGRAVVGNLSTELASQLTLVTLDPLVTELATVSVSITGDLSNKGALLSMTLATQEVLSTGPAVMEAHTTQPAATEDMFMEPVATGAWSTEHTATEAPSTKITATEALSIKPTATEAPYRKLTATEAPPTKHTATEAPSTELSATEAPSTELSATEAPSTEPSATETPSTELSATEAPSTELSATEAPSTEPSATEAPSTEPTATEAFSAESTAIEGLPVNPTIVEALYTKSAAKEALPSVALSMEPATTKNIPVAASNLSAVINMKNGQTFPPIITVAPTPTRPPDHIPVKQCLLAILILALVATVFLVCTVVLAVRLSRKNHTYPVRNYSPTEMVCISSLLPDGGEGPPAMANGRLPKAKSQGLMPEPGEDHEGDDLTLHSFLP